MRYVVLGVGRQGWAAVYDLLQYCDADEVLAGDKRFVDRSTRHETEKLLQSLLPERHQQVRLQPLDLESAADRRQWPKEMRGYDVVLSALPWRYNLIAAELAAEADVPMCDMGGNPEMVEQQRSAAQKRRQVLVPECGLAPGIANIFLKYLKDRFGAIRLKAYCGGLPATAPDPVINPLQYKLVFSPEGLISEYLGLCPRLCDGQLQYQPALSGWERFDEQHEAFYTSNISPRIFEYLAGCGIRDCEYKTLRYHGHLGKIQVLQSLGFLRGPGNTDDELARRFATAGVYQFDRVHDRDHVLLCVRGISAEEKRISLTLQETMDEKTPFTAMEKTTCWGTTIVAQALAQGHRPQGFFATPEQFIDGSWFLDELRRRTDGLSIDEESP